MARIDEDDRYRRLLREQADGDWLAALVSIDPENRFEIDRRFTSWLDFQDFQGRHDPLFEVRTHVADPDSPQTLESRRLSSQELVSLAIGDEARATFVLVSFRAPENGKVMQFRLVFSLDASERLLAMRRGYRRHRTLWETTYSVLSARDAQGRITSSAQRQALLRAVASGVLPSSLLEAPHPTKSDPLFAFEFEVDRWGNAARVVDLYRQSQIERTVIDESPSLLLARRDAPRPKIARAFRSRGLQGQLEPARTAVAGQEAVQLRIVSTRQASPIRWNRLQIGPTELVEQAALAKFGLVNAYLEKHRREKALAGSRLDLFAQPAFAGLNIAGGVAGVGFPIGEASRLFYNVVVRPQHLPRVPSVAELRKLFRLLAAKKTHHELKFKPGSYLSRDDIPTLKRHLRGLSDEGVMEALREVTDEDLRALLALARLQNLDAKYQIFADILTDVSKVSGEAESGLLRDIFNSPYFALSGSVSLKGLLALALGEKEVTQLSDFSLEDLTEGRGPTRAWLQFLDVSVDIRSVANTVSQLFHRSRKAKLLKKPFAYAPNVTELAAYEIRIFGYPLLIYYKRGLLKSDYEAYTTDYAYGIIGTRIVERFPTKAAFEEEVKGGRVYPLGYVSAVNAQGQMKKTHLAVFAHRIPDGKHAGKTAIIIYGLKAFEDYSTVIQRQLTRVGQFQAILKKGGVIERHVEVSDRGSFPSKAFEPRIHVGRLAIRDRFRALLAELSEWRYLKRATAMGLISNDEPAAAFSTARARLTARGLSPDSTQLLGVSPFQSRFRYRAKTNGSWETIEVICIPTPESIFESIKQAERDHRVESARRMALLKKEGAVVLLNEAIVKDGHYEMGPLLSDPDGRVLGYGVRTDEADVASILQAIDRELPVSERASLERRGFAGHLVQLDIDGDSVQESIFLTMQFPIGSEARYEMTDPETNERTIKVYHHGLSHREITERTILEREYGRFNREIGSQTHVNLGTSARPRKGPLIEATRTLDVWFHKRGAKRLPPHSPQLRKIIANFVTGEIWTETYGVFDRPLRKTTPLLITESQLDSFGNFVHATVWDNGKSPEDFARDNRSKLINPVKGRHRFDIRPAPVMVSASQSKHASAYSKTDVLTGTTVTNVVTHGNRGRIERTAYRDPVDGDKALHVELEFEYSERFYLGQKPTTVIQRDAISGRVLERTEMIDFDPLTGRSKGISTSYNGLVTTNIWKQGWHRPIEVSTAHRRTVQSFNREQTSLEGRTVDIDSGEILRQFQGHYDRQAKSWSIRHVHFYQPGVTNRVEIETVSPFGKRIATRIGDVLESRAIYDSAGVLRSNRVTRLASSSQRPETLHRIEDRFRWDNGSANFRVRRYVNDRLYDTFRRQTDSSGRITIDKIRQQPGLTLKTTVEHEGTSNRRLVTRTVQNGALRRVSRVTSLNLEDSSRPLVTFSITPAWGLPFSETYRLGDPLGRPVMTVYADGKQLRYDSFFPGTARPQTAIVVDRHGRPIERLITALNAGTIRDTPYDLIHHHRVSPWGAQIPTHRSAVVRGSEVIVYQEADQARTYFDLTKPYSAPRYAVDMSGRSGRPVVIDGQVENHVTSLFQVKKRRRSGIEPAFWPSKILQIDELQLSPLFHYRTTTQLLDPAGHILHESLGKVNERPQATSTEQSLKAALARPEPMQQSRFHYAAGWLVPTKLSEGDAYHFQTEIQAATDRSNALPVNQTGDRDFVTSIDTYRLKARPEHDRQIAGQPFRRRHSPSLLRNCSHFPARTNLWHAWDVTTYTPSGELAFESKEIHTARGVKALTETIKRGPGQSNGRELAYCLPGTEDIPITSHRLSSGNGSVILRHPRSSKSDFSRSDFVYFYIDRTKVASLELTVTDEAGNAATVRDPAGSSHPGPFFWAPARENQLYLPNWAAPERIVILDAGDRMSRKFRLYAVAITDLSRQLNIRHLKTFSLHLELLDGEKAVALSPIYSLAHNAKYLADENPIRISSLRHWERPQFSQLSMSRPARTSRERYLSHDEITMLRLHGLPVAVHHAITGGEKPHMTTIWDYSNPPRPRPLYSMWSDDGIYVQHYALKQGPGSGTSLIYTVGHGFSVPQVRLYRSDRLGQDERPGFLAYGYDYEVGFDLRTGFGLWGQSVASLENRIGANVFRLAGRSFLEWGGAKNRPALPDFDYEILHDARIQARHIAQLPTLAEGFIQYARLPWEDNEDAASTNTKEATWNINRNRLSLRIYALNADLFDITTLLKPETPLLPTRMGGPDERYVNTSEEGALVRLSLELGESAVAEGILSFYWKKSRGGQIPLHDSYDRITESSLTLKLTSDHPQLAARSAGTQLAIADAALRLGLLTNNEQWLTLGRNLLDTVLTDYRLPQRQRGSEPRGIMRHPYRAGLKAYGVTLWPTARRYSLKTNAEAYLLMARLLNALRSYSGDDAWRMRVRTALLEQGRWLRRYVLPQAERSGVVTKGHFDLRDIAGGTKALAPERWTAAEDWLALLEILPELGVDRATQHHWLEQLLRAHGASVDNRWGLDWSTPVLRAPSISPRLTARLARVATKLDHAPARRLALKHLNALASHKPLPLLISPMPPKAPFRTGQGDTIYPLATTMGWPTGFLPYSEWLAGDWKTSKTVEMRAQATLPTRKDEQKDWELFILVTGLFYASLLLTSLFWWYAPGFGRQKTSTQQAGVLIPDDVLEQGERRWAQRVLGLQNAADAEHSRYSNAPVEANFLTPLRVLYKLVIEWRRQENGWELADYRIVDDETDPWLNGADELACVVGLYMRHVIKQGAKDGAPRDDIMKENEDSNHIWSRLLMFLQEHYSSLFSLLQKYNRAANDPELVRLRRQVPKLLEQIGMRRRDEPFDARKLFNYPDNPDAFDLLTLQRPGITLDRVMQEAGSKLAIPYSHIQQWIQKYKDFKRLEDPYPIHPYIIEFAKLLPHFLLMGLGALIWYNDSLGESPIIPYLGNLVTGLVTPASLVWALPLAVSLLAGTASRLVATYRFSRPPIDSETASETSGNGKSKAEPSPLAKPRSGHLWHRALYDRIGWGFRAIGFFFLATALFRIETPTFATFFVVKGLFAMLALMEVGAILLPSLANLICRRIQDCVSDRPTPPRLLAFLNRLNLTVTRPASPTRLSFHYHFQPSVLSGSRRELIEAVVVYFVLNGLFLFVGGAICQQIFSLWLTDTFLKGTHWRLFFGGLVLWNTMYLLRYGLFILLTGLGSFAATYPIKATALLIALTYGGMELLDPQSVLALGLPSAWLYGSTGLLAALMIFEEPLLGKIRQWSRSVRHRMNPLARAKEKSRATPQSLAQEDAKLGIVYISGDELSCQKLTPEVLIERWQLLKYRYASMSARLIEGMHSPPTDEAIFEWLKRLYELERRFDVTLWHTNQLTVEGSTPSFPVDSGLNLVVEDDTEREEVLSAWQIRRWLVTMMSPAGHSQDTAINLVDMAVRLANEGWADRSVFYLIQNKYTDSESDRPNQRDYTKDELGHREKLATLLETLAPGITAYSLCNWTPFGFKAGGLTAMDLVPETTLQLRAMVLLDRNAIVHDLDAWMADVNAVWNDPEIVVVIPGRSTTNTLTPVGQGSQMVEEGHRSFLKGLMKALGGGASEAVGTGWGNIVTYSSGIVQRAMLDPRTALMPLTSRMLRGSSLAARKRGLIGFTPHAVGISEDTWAVSQAAHNIAALGGRVKCRLSQAIWHKMRETWSHSEWLAAFPRWSGGYLQMMNDVIMQRINDFGPSSVFARELRANSGRNFLSAPFALLNILLLPLAILWNVTPFVEILIILWNLGFVMNQVLSIHGLTAYLEATGFYRSTAILGFTIAGLLGWSISAWHPFIIPLLLFGILYGGFLVGFHRWLVFRLRDILLFGPQLALHAMGQLMRQTLEFKTSGAAPTDARRVDMAFRTWVGPREDQPLSRFPHFINLKTVVWVIGLPSIVLNLFALSRLDMLNVLLVLPSILFIVSLVIGPFVTKPPLQHASRIVRFISKSTAWICCLCLYIAASLAIAHGGWVEGLGFALLGLVITAIGAFGLQYGLFRPRLKQCRRKLMTVLTDGGLERDQASTLCDRIIALAPHGWKRVHEPIAQTNLKESTRERLRDQVDQAIHPLLNNPIEARRSQTWTHRPWLSIFFRSWTLAFFTLIWFFIVPVPGSFVFIAGSYRFALDVESTLLALFAIVAVAIAGYVLALGLQQLPWLQNGRLRVERRARNAHRSLTSLRREGVIDSTRLTHLFALFAGLQIYIDQYSYAYARKTLETIEAKLTEATEPVD